MREEKVVKGGRSNEGEGEERSSVREGEAVKREDGREEERKSRGREV